MIITGGSKGIGRSLALLAGSYGHELVLMARNAEKLAEVCELINSNGGKAEYITTDVSRSNNFKKDLQKAASILGRVDIAVLGAGMGSENWFRSLNTDIFKRVIDTNLHSVVAGLEVLIPLMMQQGSGYIAAISSLADARGFPGSSFYSSSKAALSNILESARIEMKPRGITIATVKPGFVKTDMTSGNDYSMPFLLTPEKAASIIYSKMMKGKKHIYFPRLMSLVSHWGKLLPAWFFERAAGYRLGHDKEE